MSAWAKDQVELPNLLFEIRRELASGPRNRRERSTMERGSAQQGPSVHESGRLQQMRPPDVVQIIHLAGQKQIIIGPCAAGLKAHEHF